MKIIKLEITNNRKVKAFRLTLDGDNLHVAGDVSQGKTTAISALWDILNKKSDAITHGEHKGAIRIKLSDGNKTIIAERINTKKTSTVKLTKQDGDGELEKISVADFKQMISELSVNPHKISDMGPSEQVATLLKAAKVDVDLNAVDVEIETLERERLGAYRDMEAIKPGPRPEKVDKVSMGDLLAEKDKADAHNKKVENAEVQLMILKDNIKDYEKEIADLEDVVKSIKAKKELIAETEARIIKGDAIVADMHAIDTAPIVASMQDADAINDKAQAYSAWADKDARHKDAHAVHVRLQADILAKRTTKKDALETAVWPLDGLSIADGNIVYNGALLDNLGESEKMLVCSALAINDIKNHPLKVVRLDGIESMGRDDFERLVKLFNDEDIQVLSTRVARNDVEPDEIEIVDGCYIKEDEENE